MSAVLAEATGIVRPREFLAFNLGAEEYGIDIQQVQELRGYEAVTRIANAPAYVKGVVNLRGVIVPIIDLRIRFSLGEPSYDQFTVVVILKVRDRVIGLVVDGVSDVAELHAEQIKSPPDLGSTIDAGYVTGLATIGERMLILVDVERLLSGQELGLLAAAAN
ncbi:MAG TPA: chemotaxis protein CheW [Telluria sp.]